MRRFIKSLKSDEKAATSIEYGLIISLVVLAIMAAVQGVATKTNAMWNNVSNEVTNN